MVVSGGKKRKSEGGGVGSSSSGGSNKKSKKKISEEQSTQQEWSAEAHGIVIAAAARHRQERDDEEPNDVETDYNMISLTLRDRTITRHGAQQQQQQSQQEDKQPSSSAKKQRSATKAPRPLPSPSPQPQQRSAKQPTPSRQVAAPVSEVPAALKPVPHQKQLKIKRRVSFKGAEKADLEEEEENEEEEKKKKKLEEKQHSDKQSALLDADEKSSSTKAALVLLPNRSRLVLLILILAVLAKWFFSTSSSSTPSTSIDLFWSRAAYFPVSLHGQWKWIRSMGQPHQAHQEHDTNLHPDDLQTIEALARIERGIADFQARLDAQDDEDVKALASSSSNLHTLQTKVSELSNQTFLHQEKLAKLAVRGEQEKRVLQTEIGSDWREVRRQANDTNVRAKQLKMRVASTEEEWRNRNEKFFTLAAEEEGDLASLPSTPTTPQHKAEEEAAANEKLPSPKVRSSSNSRGDSSGRSSKSSSIRQQEKIGMTEKLKEVATILDESEDMLMNHLEKAKKKQKSTLLSTSAKATVASKSREKEQDGEKIIQLPTVVPSEYEVDLDRITKVANQEIERVVKISFKRDTSNKPTHPSKLSLSLEFLPAQKGLIDLASVARGGAALSHRYGTAGIDELQLTSPPYSNPSLDDMPRRLLALIGITGKPTKRMRKVGALGGARVERVVAPFAHPFVPTIGDCYAFQGTTGTITVTMHQASKIKAVGVFSLHSHLAHAPQQFRLLGWHEGLPFKYRRQTPIDLGVFEYDSSSSSAKELQVFELQYEHQGLDPPLLHAVTMQLIGGDRDVEYTCLYRLQLLA